MCTVSYIPCKSGVIFSSCRDEDPLRAKAYLPTIKQGRTGKLLFPADGRAGGSWLGMHERGHLIILLNGGFKNHVKKSSYSKSRGLIMLDLLDNNNPLAAWHHITLNAIEPFTLLLWQNRKPYELVWDGEYKHCTLKNPFQPHLWSSATLYDDEARQVRKKWFDAWHQSAPMLSAQSLKQMLLQHNDPLNGFVMNRNEKVKTLSISLIRLNEKAFTLSYHDLHTNTITTVSMNIKKHHETFKHAAKDFVD